ncbi:MAG: hypothetical protein J0H98_05530 [Solirubrobacterales bacterium]|nr:hypothetical protein [Solirubrobacterales bacterium]
MSRIKTMFLAMVAVLAIGAVGASAAQAGTGHITTDYGACDFTFTSGAINSPDPIHSGWASSRELTNFAPDTSAGKSCDASDIDAALHLHWKSDGTAEAIGTITIPGLFGNCTYSGTLTGTYSGGTFTLNPSPQTVSLSSGFLCPDPITVSNPTSLTP